MIDWYRLPEKKALGLTLTIATAQNPITITAGKVFNLSLNGFCTVSIFFVFCLLINTII